MLYSRRGALKIGAAAAGALALGPDLISAALRQSPADQLFRAIPSTGEEIPAVGLGTASTFSKASRIFDEFSNLHEVLRTFTELGGRVVDAMPPYRSAERVLGQLTREIGNGDRIFWAAKLSIEGSGGRDAGEMQIAESLEDLGHIDLYQIDDLLRWQVQMPLMQDLKDQGRVRYIGVTVTDDHQYDDLAEVMRGQDIDFVQLDYAIDNRSAEEILIPLARERKLAVIANRPFGQGRLFRRVGDRPVPPWAADFGANTWARFFLKWVLANETVTAVVAGTSNADHVRDNMGAGTGRLPSVDERARMSRVIEDLPEG